MQDANIAATRAAILKKIEEYPTHMVEHALRCFGAARLDDLNDARLAKLLHWWLEEA